MFTSRTFRDYVYKQLDLEDPYLVYLCVQLLLCKKAPLLIKNWFEESRRLHFHSEKEFSNTTVDFKGFLVNLKMAR